MYEKTKELLARMKEARKLDPLIKTDQTDMDKCYGEAFRWLREREGLTQSELEKKVNFDISENDYVAKIESGELRPIRSFDLRLAHALNVDQDWFENTAQDLLIDKIKSEIDNLLNSFYMETK